MRGDLYDAKTLFEMNMHTGFAVRGYDLARPGTISARLYSPEA